jgi:glycosyltransferase involved in cell wall biosynthesis
MTQPKVAIDVRKKLGMSGGVSSFIADLLCSLGRLRDGSEAYTVIVDSQAQLEVLKPLIGPNQRLVIKTEPANRGGHLRAGEIRFAVVLKRALGPLLPAARYLQRLLSVPGVWPQVPISDGFYESLGCDVLHITTQDFVLCALPTIYNPHDLQHLHYPQFFTPDDIAWRETVYPAGCRLANTVVVGSQWIKDDVIRQYRIDPDKVQVIPEAPSTQRAAAPKPEFVASVQEKYRLPRPFAMYPAVTWPHKNHIRLLEALAYLRDSRGLVVNLVCAGSRQEFWPEIEKRIDQLNLGAQVKSLGFIPEEDLRAVYRLSQFLVMPSLFEAISLPVFDAWAEGVPVVCSSATALPDQVRDAAVLFDPHSVESIGEAIGRVSTSVELQQKLRERGAKRVMDFSWERTAKAYRAVYRRAAHWPLTDEDRWLLSWDWIRAPERGIGDRLPREERTGVRC